MVNSKQKGAQFERDVCVKLSRWLTQGKREDVLWRSAMSGGRATVRGKQGKKTDSQHGDISAVSVEGHALLKLVTIECKFVKDLNLRAAVIDGGGSIKEYWTTLVAVTPKGKHSMLIAKQNRFDALVFMEWSLAGILGLRGWARARLYLDDAEVCVFLLTHVLSYGALP